MVFYNDSTWATQIIFTFHANPIITGDAKLFPEKNLYKQMSRKFSKADVS